MSTIKTEWTGFEKNTFRFFFLYFLIQIVPLDPDYYLQLFSAQWSDLYYGNIFYLAHYAPDFFNDGGLTSWLLIALVALVGTAIWAYRDTDKKEYRNLYYWLRVLLRYRLALGV